MANTYQPPVYAGKPPTGLHLDVLKGDKLVQKLMIDAKKCFFFGRNPQLCDFVVDHQSCSRVHAALWWHKHLERAFLIDLGSTHGTFIGSMRLENDKPTPLPIDSTFHFGASTRRYILRERPQTAQKPIMEELERSSQVRWMPLGPKPVLSTFNYGSEESRFTFSALIFPLLTILNLVSQFSGSIHFSVDSKACI
jgi:nuclear inhibitor of protein phosphatase 1